MLRQALGSLLELEVPEESELTLIVGDNEGSDVTRGIFEECVKDFPFETSYLPEPKRGIVHVRNAVLQKSIELNADYLAFFDDDETVAQTWLKELVRCAKDFDAQAISGRVQYQLPADHEGWLTERNFFGSKDRKTGSRQPGASTNNVLIDLNFVREHDLSFHEQLNKSGASDTHFFRDVRRAGGVIVWCNEAVAYEEVPSTRLTEEWILRRAFKTAYAMVIRNNIHIGRFRSFLRSIRECIFQLSLYFGGLVKYYKGSKSDVVYNKRRWYKTKGTISALLGKSHEEYRDIHGH